MERQHDESQKRFSTLKNVQADGHHDKEPGIHGDHVDDIILTGWHTCQDPVYQDSKVNNKVRVPEASRLNLKEEEVQLHRQTERPGHTENSLTCEGNDPALVT